MPIFTTVDWDNHLSTDPQLKSNAQRSRAKNEGELAACMNRAASKTWAANGSNYAPVLRLAREMRNVLTNAAAGLG